MCVQKCIVQELVINKITFFRCVQLNNLVSEPGGGGPSVKVIVHGLETVKLVGLLGEGQKNYTKSRWRIL